MMSDVFFLIGCFRSGTTALAKILGTADNVESHVELRPKLLLEAHELHDAPAPEGREVLLRARNDQIQACLSRGRKFGDKNPAYLSFLPALRGLWDCKIVFMTRDGRDVVRSLMDWHAFKAPVIYAREVDGEPGPDKDPADDPWDFTMPRPGAPERERLDWRTMSRFQKCAWFWSHFNAEALARLSAWPTERWLAVDISGLELGTVEQVFDFLGLTGFDPASAAPLLNSRVNSLEERMGLPDSFPAWRDWSGEARAEFDRFAGPMMARLGYDKGADI